MKTRWGTIRDVIMTTGKRRDYEQICEKELGSCVRTRCKTIRVRGTIQISVSARWIPFGVCVCGKKRWGTVRVGTVRMIWGAERVSENEMWNNNTTRWGTRRVY